MMGLKPGLPDMSDNDWIRAANEIKAFADGKLSGPVGDFDRNYALGIRHIAQAYIHADDTNQAMMKRLYGLLFALFHVPQSHPLPSKKES